MACERQYVLLMHKYFDGEASEKERAELYKHINHCEVCSEHYNELKRTIAFVQSSSHISAPSDFTANVLKQLPESKKATSRAWKRWVRRHPFLVAAALFIVFMSSSIVSIWNHQEGQLMVSGAGNFQIDKETGTVVVPEGEVVEGDLTIRNGKLEVAGEVNGSILLINSEQYLASAGSVSGEIKEINQVLEWTWYHIKEFLLEVINVFDGEKES
ncbi:anti-sigma factor family protein [Alkalihalobacterium chitinilyticum]|uniref:Anti-sigma-W factor RsiW n=1 Tax=Alkalihalobacterium chitinilyticum TaxID=2980103 RepID=A0ABT5VKZ2_9BACI|nr:anti-sigma factor [Alkalihalobacterium chitinilyticum]MDE5416118.1 anti-sigma factor [Alkalihalobacterium chitinilyticum]